MSLELWIALVAAVVGIAGFVASRLLRRRDMEVGAEALFVICIAAFFVWGINILYYTSDVDKRLTEARSQVTTAVPPTEAIFQTELARDIDIVPPWWKFWKWGFDPDADKIREWRAARSDHRLLAYTIMFCKNPTDVTNPIDVQHMPGATFSALLLDLTPNGDHIFKTGPTGENKILIEPVDRFVLSLSDSIARTRMAAVAGAAGSVTSVFWLGVIALVVGGLTTLFVTLQGRLKPPPDAPTAAQDGPARAAPRRWWPWSGYGTVAFLAIFFSIVGTTLTGVKQFYDPSRLVVQNQHTLPKLWRLHQEVVLNTRCEGGHIRVHPDRDKTSEEKMAAWISMMGDLRSQIALEYAAYGTAEQSQQQLPPQPVVPASQPVSSESSSPSEPAAPPPTQPPPDQTPPGDTR